MSLTLAFQYSRIAGMLFLPSVEHDTTATVVVTPMGDSVVIMIGTDQLGLS
jgi:hypothetical protein